MQSRYLVATLVAYAIAKIGEDADATIFAVLDGIGGHALKHLVAALGMAAVVVALRRRKLAATGETEG